MISYCPSSSSLLLAITTESHRPSPESLADSLALLQTLQCQNHPYILELLPQKILRLVTVGDPIYCLFYLPNPRLAERAYIPTPPLALQPNIQFKFHKISADCRSLTLIGRGSFEHDVQIRFLAVSLSADLLSSCNLYQVRGEYNAHLCKAIFSESFSEKG